MMIPRAWLFDLYVSGRYLQELAVALRLIDVHTWYARPGIFGVIVPRLYVQHPGLGWLNDIICATCLATDEGKLEWWFIRITGSGTTDRICQPGDMTKTARLIVEEIGAERWT